MRYELYIDVFFLVNYLMDLILLRLSAEILRQKVSLGRLLTAGAAGAAAACAVVWVEALLPGKAESAALRAFGGAVFIAGTLAPAALLSVLAYRPRSVRELLKETLLLCFLAAASGGLMEFLMEHTAAGYDAALAVRGSAEAGLSLLMWVFLVCGGVFLFRYLWMAADGTRRERAALCSVTLHIGEESLQVTAYRDSGNTLTEPESGRPVSIVSERVWTEMNRAAAAQGKGLFINHIRYRTICSPLEVMEITQIDSLELYLQAGAAVPSSLNPASSAAGTERENHPWIARAPFPLTREGNYEMLLHRDL